MTPIFRNEITIKPFVYTGPRKIRTMAHCGKISKEMKFLLVLFEWFDFNRRFVSVGPVFFWCFSYQLEQLYCCQNDVSYCICCWI